jgi:basic membrane lipoprotein Med (substrate-binding protein (PBP1-ABC) superfamily)
VHAFAPEKSAWTAAHELGREHLKQVMGASVTTTVYQCTYETAYEVMEQAVEDGAQVIFATTPPMIGACRQIAAKYTQVRVLNCSLSMPYAGVRTYYTRIHEGKFITGAIAGAMAPEGSGIGYVANYPIIGTIASINAFALGVRLTNPRARVKLRWSCVPGNPIEEFLDEGVSVISNRDTGASQPHWAWEWGTYQLDAAGGLTPLASPRWHWGKFYELVARSIFAGSWETLGVETPQKAVNYWWGMSSGVIDVALAPGLPEGLRVLAELLKKGITEGTLDPFKRRILDQQGNVRNEGDRVFTPSELMHMDWLSENVVGSFPKYEEIAPIARPMVDILGIPQSLKETGSK